MWKTHSTENYINILYTKQIRQTNNKCFFFVGKRYKKISREKRQLKSIFIPMIILFLFYFFFYLLDYSLDTIFLFFNYIQLILDTKFLSRFDCEKLFIVNILTLIILPKNILKKN